MICFRDTTFCNSPVCEGKCGRRWTKELELQAIKWGGPDAPVAFSDFCSPQQEQEVREDE